MGRKRDLLANPPCTITEPAQANLEKTGQGMLRELVCWDKLSERLTSTRKPRNGGEPQMLLLETQVSSQSSPHCSTANFRLKAFYWLPRLQYTPDTLRTKSLRYGFPEGNIHKVLRSAEETTSIGAAVAPAICPWKCLGKYVLDQNSLKGIFVPHLTCFETFSFKGADAENP